MSYLIAPCAGHVHVFSQGTGAPGVGLYKIDPPIPSSSGGRCLIIGIPLTYQEIVQPSVTLDDKRALYVFGSAWSEATLSGVLLLGENSEAGAQLDCLLDWYEENRISKKMGPVSLSMGSRGVSAYVTGMQLGQVDPQFNKQTFSVGMLISKD